MHKPNFTDNYSFRVLPQEAKLLYYRLLDWADDSGNCKLTADAIEESGFTDELYRLLVFGYVMLVGKPEGHRGLVIATTAEEWAKYYMMNEKLRLELEQQEW